MSGVPAFRIGLGLLFLPNLCIVSAGVCAHVRSCGAIADFHTGASLRQAWGWHLGDNSVGWLNSANLHERSDRASFCVSVCVETNCSEAFVQDYNVYTTNTVQMVLCTEKKRKALKFEP